MARAGRPLTAAGTFRAASVVLLCCVLLVGCSFAARLAYNNLDWLSSRWVNDYVDLNREQQAAFDAAFQRWWQWHRQTQLPAYARQLEALASAVTDGVEREEIGQALQAVEGFMLAALERGFEDVAQLLRSLDDAQVDELLAALQRDAEEYQQDVVALSPQRRQEKYAREAEKLLRRWLGGLSDGQQDRLETWTAQRRDLAPQWLASRQAWREAFGRVLQSRDDPGFAQRLRPLIFDPAARWDQVLRQAVEANQQGQMEMLADVLAQATPHQLQHLREELLRLAKLCERLAR